MIMNKEARRRERSKGRYVLVGLLGVSCAETDMNGRWIDVIGSGEKVVRTGWSMVDSQLGAPVVVARSGRSVAERVSKQSFAWLGAWGGTGGCKVQRSWR